MRVDVLVEPVDVLPVTKASTLVEDPAIWLEPVWVAAAWRVVFRIGAKCCSGVMRRMVYVCCAVVLAAEYGTFQGEGLSVY